MKLDTKEFEVRMGKSIDAYKNELDTVRAGRANPNVLSRINVDYYGSPTPLAHISNISVQDARQLVISPWDASLVKEINIVIPR